MSSAAGWPVVLTRTAMLFFSPDASQRVSFGEINPESQTINKSRELGFISF